MGTYRLYQNLPLIVFIHLQRKMGDKAKSLTGMFKWECSSLDFAMKWRRMRLQLQYLCLFWGQPCEERHETADETAATVMQGLGKVSCDERGKQLQLCGQERCERSCALCKCRKSPHKGQAVNFISGRNGMWHQGHLCESSNRLWGERFQSIGIDCLSQGGLWQMCVGVVWIYSAQLRALMLGWKMSKDPFRCTFSKT